MGSRTDADIAAWQQHTGITPATGEYEKALEELSRQAFEMIKIIELEKSGIRDGDGYWDGSDVIGGTLNHMTELFARVKSVHGEKNGSEKMISPKLRQFIERVVAAKMDIVVQNGHVCLGTTGAWWPMALADDLSAQLTDDLKAEIVEVFCEGDFECHELAEFLKGNVMRWSRSEKERGM
jgi:hypothetical protein